MTLLCFQAPACPLPTIKRASESLSRHHRRMYCAISTGRIPSEQQFNLQGRRSFLSEAAARAIREVYSTANSAIHSGTCAHQLGRVATDALHDARTQIASSIRASNPSEIIISSCVHATIRDLLLSISAISSSGDEFIVAFNTADSTFAMVKSIAEQKGMKLHIAGPEPSTLGIPPELDFMHFAPLLSSQTRAVIVPVVCPVTSSRPPLAELIPFFGMVGAKVVLDASHVREWHGALPDVQALRADFIVVNGSSFGAHGSALLYGSKDATRHLPPSEGGENTYVDFELDDNPTSGETLNSNFHNWAPVPERFEVATAPLASAASLAAAMKEFESNLSDKGMEMMRECRATVRLKLAACPFLEVYTSDAISGSHDCGPEEASVSFNVRGCDPFEVAKLIEEEGTLVDAATHGAARIHQIWFGFPGSLRVSFSPSLELDVQLSAFIELLESVYHKMASSTHPKTLTAS